MRAVIGSVADTAQVFHHESLQTERDRPVIMIGYSSRRPKSMSTSMAHFPAEQVEHTLRRIVPVANYQHVFGWRKPGYAAAVMGSAMTMDIAMTVAVHSNSHSRAMPLRAPTLSGTRRECNASKSHSAA